MRHHRHAAPLLIATVVLNTLAFGQNEGLKPYTPTRLEWLALDYNARLRVEFSESSGFSMAFVETKGDTILIYVRYVPSVNREAMNMAINGAREVISMDAKSRGWSSWLKMKEEVKMVETK
jgi:hypothetical protein